MISWLVISEPCSHENGGGESSHAGPAESREVHTHTLFPAFRLSPFSDCHQVLRRLGAKVVTTFSMVWLLGLVSSSYSSLESQMKHLVSS